MPVYDEDAVRRATQYDSGVAAGSPPDFDGPTPGARPVPVVEPVRALPRLGGKPIFTAPPVLTDGGGITPNAPKGDDGAPTPSPAPSGAPRPRVDAARPILTTRVDGQTVLVGSLAFVLLWWLVAGRDE